MYKRSYAKILQVLMMDISDVLKNFDTLSWKSELCLSSLGFWKVILDFGVMSDFVKVFEELWLLLEFWAIF